MFATQSKTLQLFLLSHALLLPSLASSNHSLRRQLDDTAPQIMCNMGVTLSLGSTSATAAQMVPIADLATATDNSGTVSISADPDVTSISYDCDDEGTTISVLMTASDAAATPNTATCTASFVPTDDTNPTATCSSPTVMLSTGGSVAPADLGSGTDNCGDPVLSADLSSVSCSNVGTPVSYTLTATDTINALTGTCSGSVTVEDDVAPTVTCTDIDADLVTGATPSVTVFDSDFASASDNCGTANLSGGSIMLGCDDVGSVDFGAGATDANGNSGGCSVTLNVQDVTDPTALCQSGYQVELQASTLTVTPDQLDNGSDDDCDIADMSLSQEEFGCADVLTTATSPIMVTLTVEDVSSNTASCDVPVTVVDVSQPEMNCAENVEVSLDANGNAVTTAAMILNGVNDNCDAVDGFPIITGGVTTLSCSNIGQGVTVTVQAEDVSGNLRSCQEDFIAVDDAGPTPTCPPQTVDLSSADGMASLDQTTTSATDNCSADGDIVTQFPSGLDYSCNDIGSDTVTITFTDEEGNQSTCDMAVTITDSTGFCAPSTSPSSAPSMAPSSAPSVAPSSAPSSAPSESPSSAPSGAPSSAPTPSPTEQSFLGGFFDSIMDLINFLIDLLFGGFLGSVR